MASAKTLVLGGVGAPPGLDDVRRVAGGMLVALDSVAADRIKRESPPPKAFSPEADSSSAGGSAPPSTILDCAQSRAVLAARLASLANGRTGVRLSVAEFLRDLLNAGVCPALGAGSGASEARVLSDRADACKAGGFAFYWSRIQI